MAELVGVIASGIGIGTLAVQIASSLAKLKDYWSQIKETPEDIRMLVEEIENLQLLLCDIQDDRARSPMSSALLDQAAASRCIEHCKRGADRLKKLVDDLGNDVLHQRGLKRKWASAKVVLDKNKIDKYKSGLESSVKLLSLAYQCYTKALIQQQPDIIIARMTEIMATIRMPTQNPPIDSHRSDSSISSTIVESEHPFEVGRHESIPSSRFEPEYYSRRSRWRQKTTAKYHFQAKLLNRAWAFQFLNNVSGWKFQIRTYTFRSRDSLASNYAATGNIEGIQELFSKRLASPNDIDEASELSLLENAALWGELDMCHFLLEQGADVNLSACSPSRALECWIEEALWHSQPPGAAANGISMLRPDMEITTSILKRFRGSIEGFRQLLREIDEPYYSLPLEERFEVAMGFMIWNLTSGAELVRAALGPGPISPEAIKHKMKDGMTLLHGVAYVLGQAGRRRYRKRHYPTLWNSYALPGWRDLANELIEGGADLHGLWQKKWELVEDIELEECRRQPIYETPLISLFKGLSAERFNWSGHYVSRIPQGLLEIWLELLQTSGVNLLRYGRKEAKLLEKQSVQREIPFFLARRGGRRYDDLRRRTEDYLRLDEISYGSSVADWKLPEFDSMATWSGEFWGLVEREMMLDRLAESKSHPSVLIEEMPMPGGWVF